MHCEAENPFELILFKIHTSLLSLDLSDEKPKVKRSEKDKKHSKIMFSILLEVTEKRP